MFARPYALPLILALAACGESDATGPLPPPPAIGAAGDGRLAVVLEDIRLRHGLPALAAVLVRGGAVIETAATGVRATGQSPAVTTDDRWHIGSLTKSMTATLAAILVERGEIAWTTRVRDVFPDLVSATRNEYRDVSLAELLSHTGGFATDLAQAPSWSGLRGETGPLRERRRAFAAELLTLPPAGPRGSYAYSNGGYVVAGTMLEEVTGELWEDLMRQELFGPLGMTATGFGAPGTPGVPNQPWGHVRQGTSWLPIAPGPQADNPEAVGPAGTVHTTLADYARYVAAHLAGARGTGGLLPSAAFTRLHTAAPGTSYALGWGVGTRSWANGRVLQHSGSNTLWFAVVWIAPERDLAMFAVANAANDAGAAGTDDAIGALVARFEAAYP
jgi:CubicO group peptidase (beta-lactamase class C family)